MSDIADDIRAAVNRTAPPTALKHLVGQPDEDFMKLRAKVRGTIIAAKQEIVGTGEWTVTDDRILDIVTTWLENQRSK
ncbi:MAG: hypothetical protein ABW318_22875 [Vicinamibacterales bacterium]